MGAKKGRRATGTVRVLVAERKRRGWSQVELARRSGVDQPSISRIEAGLIDPALGTLERLAGALGMRLWAVPVLDDEGSDRAR